MKDYHFGFRIQYSTIAQVHKIIDIIEMILIILLINFETSHTTLFFYLIIKKKIDLAENRTHDSLFNVQRPKKYTTNAFNNYLLLDMILIVLLNKIYNASSGTGIKDSMYKSTVYKSTVNGKPDQKISYDDNGNIQYTRSNFQNNRLCIHM